MACDNGVLSLVKQEKKEEDCVLLLTKPEKKEEDTKEGRIEDIFFTIPLEGVRDFFWHALHLSVKGYSYTIQKAATGKFPFMGEAYFLLFVSEKLCLSKTEIQQIPAKYRTHYFGRSVSASVCHWVELTIKFDPIKKMVSAIVHYDVADGLDGLVKWYVHQLPSLLLPLLKADLSPMLPFLLLRQVLALFLRFFRLLQGYTLALDQPAPALLWSIPKAVISPLQALMQTFNDVVSEVLNGTEFLDEIADMIDEDMQVSGDFVLEESADIELSQLTSILLPLF